MIYTRVLETSELWEFSEAYYIDDVYLSSGDIRAVGV
jgi:hypothetical protein